MLSRIEKYEELRNSIKEDCVNALEARLNAIEDRLAALEEAADNDAIIDLDERLTMIEDLIMEEEEDRNASECHRTTSGCCCDKDLESEKGHQRGRTAPNPSCGLDEEYEDLIDGIMRSIDLIYRK